LEITQIKIILETFSSGIRVIVNAKHLLSFYDNGNLTVWSVITPVSPIFRSRFVSEGRYGNFGIKLDKIDNTVYVKVDDVMICTLKRNGELKVWHNDYTIGNPIYEGAWKP